jgi:hypothetical protein
VDAKHTYFLAGDPNKSSLFSQLSEFNPPGHILLNTDHSSLFKKIYINPGSPGQKKLDIVLTYFDGEDWVTKKSTFEYKVMSFAEKHQTKNTIFGIIGGVFVVDKLIELLFSYSMIKM